jgi:regulator of RNase E activity RraA
VRPGELVLADDDGLIVLDAAEAAARWTTCSRRTGRT